MDVSIPVPDALPFATMHWTIYLVFAPLGMVAGDAPDEGTMLGRNARTAGEAVPGSMSPEQLESLAVPSNHCLPPQTRRA